MDRTRRTPPSPEEASDWLGRLWDLPGVELKPLRKPVSFFHATAPAALKARIAPLEGAKLAAWRLLQNRARLGTEAVAQVPIFIPEWELGYVCDFLLPEYGVNVQIDPWVEDEPDDLVIDFTREPDHAWNLEREGALRDAFGIEQLGYYDHCVLNDPDLFLDELRKELGIGRPGWILAGRVPKA
ncbi:MAG: hypothetical protein ACT4PV_10335 [Planctomycetaceae bacterium]